MSDNPKIVTCAGFGGTGSSVITDLLKEFNNVKSLGSYEFALAHEVDGISDLQHYIVDDFHRMKVDEAIYRFDKLVHTIGKSYNPYFNDQFVHITENYINNLTKVSWNGYWHQHKFRYSKIQRYILYNLPAKFQYLLHKFSNSNEYEFVPYYKRSTMRLAYGKEDFYNFTRIYFDTLFRTIDTQNEYKYIALDQLVPPVNIPRYLNYFSDLKVIVIDRDPRDLYLLNKLYWKEGWIPTNVDIFINWFNLLREPLKNEENDKRVLRIKFEDCLFKYEETVSLIMDFLELKPNQHTKRLSFFNPNISIKNCKLWEKQNDYEDDINKIRNELSDYCYSYK